MKSMRTVCVPLVLLTGHAGATAGTSDCGVDHEKAASDSRVTSRYVPQGGVVFDKETQLTWKRCSVGQHWTDDHGCMGEVRFFSFDAAQEQAGGEWRLPTKEELASLVDQQRGDEKLTPTIDPVAFPNLDKRNYGYWSSTPSNASQGWYVGFNAGDLEFSHRYRGYLFAVRMVCDRN